MLTTAEDTMDASAGQTVTYTLQLTNTGDVTDTFDLSYVATTGWDVSMPMSMTLGAGESMPVAVSVMVPADAMSGDMGTATVMAASQGDPTKEASVELTTMASYLYYYLPLIMNWWPAP